MTQATESAEQTARDVGCAQEAGRAGREKGPMWIAVRHLVRAVWLTIGVVFLFWGALVVMMIAVVAPMMVDSVTDAEWYAVIGIAVTASSIWLWLAWLCWQDMRVEFAEARTIMRVLAAKKATQSANATAQMAARVAQEGAENLAKAAGTRSELKVMVAGNLVDVTEFVKFTTTVMDVAVERAMLVAYMARWSAAWSELVAKRAELAVELAAWVAVAQSQAVEAYAAERAVNAVRLSAQAKIAAALV